MSLLAEEVVEEWLNRQGYFTIRGVKVGNHEMDLLALKPDGQAWSGRHFEVSGSSRPMSYLTEVPRDIRRRTGRARSAKRRSVTELRQSVAEWIEKKYTRSETEDVKQRLCKGKWAMELVVVRVKYEEELDEIQRRGVRVHRLGDIIRDMTTKPGLLQRAASGDLLDLLTALRVNGRGDR